MTILYLGGGSRKAKYGNRKVVVDGHKFDSAAEGRRFRELKLQMWAEKKSDRVVRLELQPKFVVLKTFPEERPEVSRNSLQSRLPC